MGSSVSVNRCGKCNASIHEALRHCYACGFDLGAPNVRAARSTIEIEALDARYLAARAEAQQSGCLAELEALERIVQERSSVVVSMSAFVALQLVSDERNLYANYEQLVEGGVRTPATFANDSHRRAVVGTLFGSYGQELKYGVLALSDRGLPTYGEVYCRLKRVAIDERVSFLEWNSYRFAEEMKPRPSDPFPPGHRSDWERRGILAALKLAALIRPGQSDRDWEKMLVVTDGASRERDDCIEAHIYGSFNVSSLESIRAAENIKKALRTDVRAAVKKFEKLWAGK